MTRIKIRTKQNEADGVDTRSFKLGYQIGFREAEAVTIERLEKQYMPVEINNKVLNDKILELRSENKRLVDQAQRMANHIDRQPARSYTSGKELLEKEVKHRAERQPDYVGGYIPKEFGMDTARGFDLSALLNVGVSSAERRVVAGLVDTDSDIASAYLTSFLGITGRDTDDNS